MTEFQTAVLAKVDVFFEKCDIFLDIFEELKEAFYEYEEEDGDDGEEEEVPEEVPAVEPEKKSA